MVEADPLVARLRAAGCVFAEDEARLLRDAATTPAQLDAMTQDRVSGTPLEYVLGWAQFRGLRIAVEPGVFVPRRRTEFLAACAVAAVRPGGVVVDLCCGSGAIAAAVTAEAGPAEVHAVEVDPAAVRCARRNLRAASVHEGDLYDALPDALRGRVDVLVANAPYVPTEEIASMPAEARDHEHRVALDGGADGLDVQRRIAAGAAAWLAPDGVLLVETSARQAPRSAALVRAAGLSVDTVSDEDSAATVVRGRATGRP